MVKTFEQWEEILMPTEMEALEDNYFKPGQSLSPDEVFTYIVEWNGGIGSAYQIKSIISRVYGVELGGD